MLIDVQFVMGANPDASVSEGIVTNVHDGDTPKVNASIRMLGIDAPELKQEPWGKMSRDHLKKIILGKTVEIRKNSRGASVDKYGRLLRWIFLDNLCLNVELVKVGLAVPYMLTRLDYANELVNYSIVAKNNQQGVWSDPHFIIPSDFRKIK